MGAPCQGPFAPHMFGTCASAPRWNLKAFGRLQLSGLGHVLFTRLCLLDCAAAPSAVSSASGLNLYHPPNPHQIAENPPEQQLRLAMPTTMLLQTANLQEHKLIDGKSFHVMRRRLKQLNAKQNKCAGSSSKRLARLETDAGFGAGGAGGAAGALSTAWGLRHVATRVKRAGKRHQGAARGRGRI